MTAIAIGSTIIGKSGKKLIVDRIEGDTIYSGDLKIFTSAVVRVIPPLTEFKIGDRVTYIGSDFNLKTQYAGVLEVWKVSKADGYIPHSALQFSRQILRRICYSLKSKYVRTD